MSESPYAPMREDDEVHRLRAEVERLRAALAEERKACDEWRSACGQQNTIYLMEQFKVAHDARRAAEQRGPTWLDRLNSDYGAVRGEDGDTIPPRAKSRAAEQGKADGN